MSTPFSTPRKLLLFWKKERKSLSGQIVPHCSQQGHLKHPWPPAAKGSCCQLHAEPAPGWEWIYTPWGVGHHRKNISREESGKDSRQARTISLPRQGARGGSVSDLGGLVSCPRLRASSLNGTGNSQCCASSRKVSMAAQWVLTARSIHLALNHFCQPGIS